MKIPELSKDLVEWAARGGYGHTVEGGSDGIVFWTNPGGELRYYIRQTNDEWILLTFASRASSEQFELTAVSASILERYLYSLFGADIRQQTGLRRLKIGTRPESLESHCALSELDDEGYRTLFYRDHPVARATDSISSVSKLTKLSQLLEVSVDEIEESFLSKDGAPLFHV